MKEKLFLIIASLIIFYSSPSIAGCSEEQLKKMTDAGFLKSEIEKKCGTNLSGSSASNEADTSSKPANERSANEKDIFDVLSAGLGVQEKIAEGNFPQLSKSSTEDVHTLLESYKTTPNELYEDISYSEKFKVLQAYYDKYIFVYFFGNEENQWNGKLYNIVLSLGYPNEEIAEDETSVYRKLKQLYGDCTGKEKFQYSSRVNSDLNLYVWEMTDIVVTYRSRYRSEDRKTTAVVNYWDKEFYNKHIYYDY